MGDLVCSAALGDQGENSMVLFTKYGFWGAFRYIHVLSAVMWMGLLWFFNLVQTPAFAQMDPAARNNAFDKLTWRALWWFRYAALATLITGILILGVESGSSNFYNGDFWKSSGGLMISAAILFAFIMAYNVWMVIWPAQQIVIGNARNVQAGQEADPAAPAAARRGAMASRQNTIFSATVFAGMVGAQHFFNAFKTPGTGVRILFYIIVLIIAVAFEANALGVFGTEAGKPNTLMYDTHQMALWWAAGMVVFFWLFFEVIVHKA
jgi:uncharacterized membrane protein